MQKNCKKIAKKLQKSCKKIAKKLQKSCKKIAKKLQNAQKKGRVLLDPGWVSKYENSLNLNLIVPDGL